MATNHCYQKLYLQWPGPPWSSSGPPHRQTRQESGLLQLGSSFPVCSIRGGSAWLLHALLQGPSPAVPGGPSAAWSQTREGLWVCACACDFKDRNGKERGRQERKDERKGKGVEEQKENGGCEKRESVKGENVRNLYIHRNKYFNTKHHKCTGQHKHHRYWK